MERKFTVHRPKSARTSHPSGPAASRPAAAHRVTREAMKKAGSKKLSATRPDAEPPREIGGPEGPDPTRYGDWERKGICVDF